MSNPERTKNSRDIAAGALFAVLGLGGLWISSSYPLGTSFNMGPGYFPVLIFGALTLVGCVVFVQGLVISGARLEGFSLRALVLVVGSLLFFALSMRTLGFALSGALLVLLATLAAPGLTLLERVLLAVALTAFSWALFIYGLGLVVPVWPEFLR